MNILVTGSRGFIGTNIINILKNDFVFWEMDIFEKQENNYFTWNEIEKFPWDKIDVVIHLAGKAHDTKKESDAQSYFDINTELTKKIFDKFLVSNATQFIFFSSVKAVADKVETDFLSENVVPKPVGPYGNSKLQAEQYIQGQNWNEKKVYIFRPCMIHGPGNKGNFNLLYKVVNKGIPYPLGAFDNRRSFLNIWNLAFIIKQFIEKKPESGIYNLADDKPISTNQLIQLIATSTHRKAKIWKINKSFIFLIAKIGTFLRLPFNSERLQKLTENYVVSNMKLKLSIDVKDLPIKVEDGFLLTLKKLVVSG
ncbi:MAG: NAD-dependent epimerase/dehydratase family protein [Marinilabiliaceae bacterium]|nr:NAD-dependent epimerase/dehydratase family protein [Marinilabiliaceae bacterium]